MFLYVWIFKGLAFLILRFLLKRIDLALSSRKWILNLLNCKISIGESSNQHYNHKLIKLFERNFTGVSVNFNMELWFLQCYQNSNFWRTIDWLIPRMLFFAWSMSFIFLYSYFFIPIRFFVQFLWIYQTHKC